jgi:hypothetical protein
MKKEKQKFDFYRVISADYNSNLAIASSILMWASYIFFYLLQFEQQGFLWKWRIASIFVSTIAVIFLAWRRHFFYSIYVRGVEVIACIYLADAFKTGGSRIEYKYEYQGEKYWRGNALTHSSFFKYNFHSGDEVVLMIDPENPKRAVIRDIYF